MTIRDVLLLAADDLRSLAERVLPNRQPRKLPKVPPRGVIASEIRQIADRLQAQTEPTEEPGGGGGQMG